MLVEQNNGSGINRLNGESSKSEDVYVKTLESLDGCEEVIRKMQACDKLHAVSLKVIEEINHVIDSGLPDELKNKALTVLHRISDNATAFERFAGINPPAVSISKTR